jgi:hypothetical protein
VLLNEVLEGNAHLLLNDARVVNVTADAVKLGALIAFATKPGKPAGTTSANGGGDGDGLDIGDGGRAAEEANVSGERGLKARLALLSFDGFNESSLLSANVGTSTSVNVDVEIVPGPASVLANETSSVSLVDGLLDM